jgi:hypothetical protein
MCECDQEYGPCEQHSTVLVSRDGAAVRNCDEHIMCLIDDLIGVGAELSAAGRVEHKQLTDSLVPDEWHGFRFTDVEDYEAAVWLSEQLESTLGENMCVFHDDGFVIVQLHDDCPLLEG